MSLTLKTAVRADIELIKNILIENNLPHQDVEASEIRFSLVYDDENLVGVVGLEKFQNLGLLRSLVVKKSFRNKGYGTEICEKMIDYAKKENFSELYLLTLSAKEFFEKLGFYSVNRSEVPDPIQSTAEFSSLCPASAVCLKFALSKS